MIDRDIVMEFYVKAYEAETGNKLYQDQLEKNKFEDFRFEYDSKSGRSIITLYEFTDNDTFPVPDTVCLVKYDNDGWRLV